MDTEDLSKMHLRIYHKVYITLNGLEYDSMDTSLSKLQEIVEDRGAGSAAAHEVTKSGT